MKKLNNKGFSLVELIIVIAIMAILIAVLAPQFLRYVERSRYQKDNTAVEEIRNACEVAASDPNAMGGTTATVLPVICTLNHTTGVATFSAPTGGTLGTNYQGEVERTIMGGAGTAVNGNFTSNTFTAAAADIIITVSANGVTVANIPPAP